MPLKLPTTTPVPDEIFDLWLTDLSETELKVLLYIVRRTLGFRKAADAVSFKQFLHGITAADGRVIDRGCTRSRTGLSKALKSLEEKQLVRSHKGKTEAGDAAVTVYALWFEDDADRFAADPRAGVVPNAYHSGSQNAPPPVANAHQGGTQNAPTTNRSTTNRSTQDQPAPASKYTRGRYAVCPRCGGRPCLCAQLG